MDDDDTGRRPTATSNQGTNQSAMRGGTVEPANRATVAIERFQKGNGQTEFEHGRFELRDPRSDLLYSEVSFDKMVYQADSLGAKRMTAIDPDGNRSTIQRIEEGWPRPTWVPDGKPLFPEANKSKRSAAARQQAPAQTASERPAPGENPRPTSGANPTSAQPKTNTPEREQDAATVRPTARSSEPEQQTAQQAAQPPRPDRDTVSTASVAQETQSRRAEMVAKLEASLRDRYLIKRALVTMGPTPIGQTEYRFKGDTTKVAFTESIFKLATDQNSPSVARSMVDVAEARNWKALRVSGHEDFKRMVWLEATVRGVKAVGYEPNQADLELLRRERESRLVNRIEPVRSEAADRGKPSGSQADNPAAKTSARGGGGRKTVLAAIEAVLLAKQVPEKQREAVMAAAAEKLAERISRGQTPQVKIYDRAAPSRRPAPAPTMEPQRSRERAAPVR